MEALKKSLKHKRSANMPANFNHRSAKKRAR